MIKEIIRIEKENDNTTMTVGPEVSVVEVFEATLGAFAIATETLMAGNSNEDILMTSDKIKTTLIALMQEITDGLLDEEN